SPTFRPIAIVTLEGDLTFNAPLILLAIVPAIEDARLYNVPVIEFNPPSNPDITLEPIEDIVPLSPLNGLGKAVANRRITPTCCILPLLSAAFIKLEVAVSNPGILPNEPSTLLTPDFIPPSTSSIPFLDVPSKSEKNLETLESELPFLLSNPSSNPSITNLPIRINTRDGLLISSLSNASVSISPIDFLVLLLTSASLEPIPLITPSPTPLPILVNSSCLSILLIGVNTPFLASDSAEPLTDSLFPSSPCLAPSAALLVDLEKSYEFIVSSKGFPIPFVTKSSTDLDALEREFKIFSVTSSPNCVLACSPKLAPCISSMNVVIIVLTTSLITSADSSLKSNPASNESSATSNPSSKVSPKPTAFSLPCLTISATSAADSGPASRKR